MTDVAAETAQAFLTAMDTEEPFQLLRTLPGKLEELWAIEVQSASVDKHLAEEISLSQSKVSDSIHSASSRVRDRNKEITSLLDAHMRHLQREVDGLQESLQHLHHTRQFDTLPRRHRTKANPSKGLDNELLRLQDTTAQTRDIAHYICNVAADLVKEEASLNASVHKTLHELGLTIDGDAWSPLSDHPGSDEIHSSIHRLVENMEQRCEGLEAYITFNKNVIDKQTQQIVRESQLN